MRYLVSIFCCLSLACSLIVEEKEDGEDYEEDAGDWVEDSGESSDISDDSDNEEFDKLEVNAGHYAGLRIYPDPDTDTGEETETEDETEDTGTGDDTGTGEDTEY